VKERLLAHRALLGIVGLAAVATVIGLLVLWPNGERPDLSEELGLRAELVRGKVELTERVPCEGTSEGEGIDCIAAHIRLEDGPDRGDVVVVENPVGPSSPEVQNGDRLVLGLAEDAPPGQQYYFADFERRAPLLWLGLLFAVSVVALGRWRGLRALVGLGITLVVLVVFVLPALLEGTSPIAVAIVGSAVVLLVNLYLAHGFNVQTTIAVLGTLASLALIAVLSTVFVSATHLTGFADESAGLLQALSGQIDVRGLLLGGIIIGSLGVLDDVTVTQASAVWELHEANPGYGQRQLYSSAIRIGRDHIASTVNTLVLAYAGASLPLLVLLVEAQRGLGDVLTGETVAAEVVRTLVGSIGLVASVPITTALAAAVAARQADDPEVPSAGVG
jgi:uncharacterized membrane protein